jgi:glycosyltransferase involved in cell wall biosynthesis
MARASVVLCSYNQAKYLRHSIESALGQTHADTEVVLVDNGSKDESHTIARSYAGDPRVKVILHERNEPITCRLNEAIRASTGEFVSILYSDDFYLPHKLASQVALFAPLSSAHGVVHSPGLRLDVDTNEQWEERCATVEGNVLRDLLLYDAAIHPITPLVRRRCFDDFPFDESLFVEGEAIFTRIAMKYLFRYDPKPTAVMRDHAGNIGRAIRRNAEMSLIFFDKLGKAPEFPETERDALLDQRVRVYRGAAWQGIRIVRDRAWARKMALGALRLRPSLARDPKILATLAFSVAPEAATTVLNKVVERVRVRRGHKNYVAEERLT